MKTIIIILFLYCVGFSAQNLESKNPKHSLIETGVFMSFSNLKVKDHIGFYGGYWYRYTADETDTHLELGTNFGYSKSLYDFNYGKNGELFPIRSKEFIWSFGARMVKEFDLKNNKIEWITELSMKNLFFDEGDIPQDEPRKTMDQDDQTIYIDTHTASLSSLKIGQGVRFWKNNIGFGVQASYIPYRLWYRETIPKGVNSFSFEMSFNIKF
ncbi:hypothetical protein NZ698_12265 [Chryseobacterium sp. PBS4-4]|uniref:Outer membrane protein beta-barrel domain-containing protein n=1 Tax=Chryseobacterium edaphi TaxID=2976532 RepID=A0ABT2WBF7_9FLAO|nr:hypothetical protein [Chryseobacterium edaphi]MCU7617975.1 hypothetical protein [Chryseobacterium edaphi]